MLLPMIAQTAPYREAHTLITANAGYHSDNVAKLMEHSIPALIADNQMRQRDERFEEQGKHKAKDDVLYDKQPTVQGKHGHTRPVKLFRPEDFRFNDTTTTCICPAGQTLHSPGSVYTTRIGLRHQVFTAKASDCQQCKLRGQ